MPKRDLSNYSGRMIVAFFGTPSPGFQVIRRKELSGSGRTGEGTRRLERFYSSVQDSEQGDGAWRIFAARRETDFELVLVQYGLLTAVRGGRRGGCLGISIISDQGLPSDLLNVKKEILDEVVRKFEEDGRLLGRDEGRNLGFVVARLEDLRDYLEDALLAIADRAASLVDVKTRDIPILSSDNVVIAGPGTPSNVIGEILSRVGGVEVRSGSQAIRSAAELEELFGLTLSAQKLRQPQHHRGVATDRETLGEGRPPTTRATDVANIRQHISKYRETLTNATEALTAPGGFFDILEEFLTKETRRSKSEQNIEIRPRAPVSKPSSMETVTTEVPIRVPSAKDQGVHTIDKSSKSLRVGRWLFSSPLFAALVAIVLIVVVFAVTAIVMFGAGTGRNDKKLEKSTNGGLQEPYKGDQGGRSSSPPRSEGREFLDVEEFLSAMVSRRNSANDVEKVINDIIDFLWEKQTIRQEHKDAHILYVFIKDSNKEQLDGLDLFLKRELQKIQRNGAMGSAGVPYFRNQYWRIALNGGEGSEGLRIR